MRNPIDKVINSTDSRHRMTAKEAASYIGCSENTLKVWRCTKRHNIPFYRLGRSVFYKQQDLDDWIESKRVAA